MPGGRGSAMFGVRIGVTTHPGPQHYGAKIAPRTPFPTPTGDVMVQSNDIGHPRGEMAVVPRYLSASEWERRGVEVQHLSGALPIYERETTLTFVGREEYAEVSTAHRSWQRRLESLGCVPSSITIFRRSAIDIRYYEGVPRQFVRMPTRGRKALA